MVPAQSRHACAATRFGARVNGFERHFSCSGGHQKGHELDFFCVGLQ
jgi:hypothetical protein